MDEFCRPACKCADGIKGGRRRRRQGIADYASALSADKKGNAL
jgi:hypothetical protein